MKAKRFVNSKLGDKNYTHSEFKLSRETLKEWLTEFAESEVKNLHIQNVNRWAYVFDNWQPIMLGIAMALAFNVIVTMFENVIVKIALIIHGC